MDRKALSAAFPVTVPVLMGYLAIGIAFGLMLQEIGYNFIWAFFMSLTIYQWENCMYGANVQQCQSIYGNEMEQSFMFKANLPMIGWIYFDL